MKINFFLHFFYAALNQYRPMAIDRLNALIKRRKNYKLF